MLVGSRAATLREVAHVDIHGTRFVDVRFVADDEPGLVVSARFDQASAYANPQPGDAVTVAYLMNMPVRLERRTS